MMTPEQKQLIKATVPVLKEHGLLLTTHFYQRVFAGNPELQHVFNQANQQNGRQPMALATVVLAYAENIDNPSVLGSALNRIGHKHTSLDIRPEHYGVIGHHLIASIHEVLGDAATPALLDAWTAAYQQLANLMIDIEADLYAAQVAKPGGWTGWRPFTVKTRVSGQDDSMTFQLYPTDGGPVADCLPEQYLHVRLFVTDQQLLQACPYRVVSAPNGLYYTIVVKRGGGKYERVSNQLLDNVQPGDHLNVSAPAGFCPMAVAPQEPAAIVRTGGCPMHQVA